MRRISIGYARAEWIDIGLWSNRRGNYTFFIIVQESGSFIARLVMLGAMRLLVFGRSSSILTIMTLLFAIALADKTLGHYRDVVSEPFA